MRAYEFRLVDVFEESTNELRLMLEHDPKLFESMSGWTEIHRVLGNIAGQQPEIGKLFSILSLTFMPPGRLLVVNGHATPLVLVKITNDTYTKYTFVEGDKLVTYPAEHQAGDISYKSFLFDSEFDLSKTLSFITLSLQDWKISDHLTKIKQDVDENFDDGKNPGRKGLSRRVGIPKKATLAQLEKIAGSSTGERRRMAQWQLNMRRGKKK
jgi:hypothetical protein